MEQKIKALGKLLTILYWAIGDVLKQDITNCCPNLSLMGKKPHKILRTWLWSRWMYLFTCSQDGFLPNSRKKTKKLRSIWLINPDEGLIRHSPHIKVWINEYCIIQARSSSSVAQVYFDIHQGETRRQTHLTGSEIHSGTQLTQISMWHPSATHGSWEQLSSQNCQCFRAVLCMPGFPGSFAWMWGVSVHQQEGRVLCLCQRWNCVISNEWALCFPPKELQAVSYFELRDPFIFWLFLLLTPISSADIRAAHGTWWHFLKMLLLYQVIPK